MCKISGKDEKFLTREEALKHLKTHRKRGDRVSQIAISRLEREVRHEIPIIRKYKEDK